jgi:hypothetical protein
MIVIQIGPEGLQRLEPQEVDRRKSEEHEIVILGSGLGGWLYALLSEIT